MLERSALAGAAVACLAVMGISACSAVATSESESSSRPPTTSVRARGVNGEESGLHVVALGDSVPSGTGCDCTPFPELSATELAAKVGVAAAVSNYAAPGLRTPDVLARLRDDLDMQSQIAAADVVEIEVGANDVAKSPACGLTVPCYDEQLATMRSDLAAIVALVHADSREPGMRIVLVDYWNVWLGGAYARARGQAYVTSAAALTDEVDSVISALALSTGAVYVDLRTAFLGADHQGDETPLLAQDGDHPNAAGHQRIADSVVSALQSNTS